MVGADEEMAAEGGITRLKHDNYSGEIVVIFGNKEKSGVMEHDFCMFE